MRLIIGLGNPGQKYVNTRHNVGFQVLDNLGAKLDIEIDKAKFKSKCGEGFYRGEKIVLLKPQTFMNLSGEAILDALQWYKLKPAELLVIYDDIALPVGRLRIRAKGSAGGHNGMKSILFQVQSEDFPRIRIGIGKPADTRMNQADFVLGKFDADEIPLMEKALQGAAEAVLKVLEQGVDLTMNEVNRL